MSKQSITNKAIYLNEFDATLKMIQGKWKPMILFKIYEDHEVRFNELQRYIGTVSHKTLTNQLRELEEDNLVNRHDYKTTPPHVGYRLTKQGQSLVPLLDKICTWADQNIDKTLLERSLCDE